MKLAITGKGGVGKTTLSALLAQTLNKRDYQVIAIDADPDANLAEVMGCADHSAMRPLVELKDLIEERTGVKPGTSGGMFQLNPFVADIADRYSVDVRGVKLLVAGSVKRLKHSPLSAGPKRLHEETQGPSARKRRSGPFAAKPLKPAG